MQETLHKHNGSNESIDDAEAIENGSNKVDKEKIVQKNENLFLNWPFMSSIIAYCVFSLHDIAYQEVKFIINEVKLKLIIYICFLESHACLPSLGFLFVVC